MIYCTTILSVIHSCLSYIHPHPLINSLAHSLMHLTTCSFAHLLAQNHSPTHPLTHPPIHPPTHSVTHSLTHSLAHSLTHSLTHSLIHSLTHESKTRPIIHPIIHSHHYWLIYTCTRHAESQGLSLASLLLASQSHFREHRSLSAAAPSLPQQLSVLCWLDPCQSHVCLLQLPNALLQSTASCSHCTVL